MIYDLIAPIYDLENQSIDYELWADFFEKQFDKHLTVKPELVLDLGCGTGKMTLTLAKRGYDMTGVDYSSEMLDVARREETVANAPHPVLWLCQDMREFELYGTVDACVCCLDTINHITRTKDLKTIFSLVHNYLFPDGLFIFDINGKGKFERVYANEVYTYEGEDSFLIWENDYRAHSGLCDFYITLFKKEEDGRYVRFDEMQTERAYSLKTIRKYLAETGFEYIGAYSDFDETQADDEDERIYFVARCIKKEQI